jgi:hypothetical protein
MQNLEISGNGLIVLGTLPVGEKYKDFLEVV